MTPRAQQNRCYRKDALGTLARLLSCVCFALLVFASVPTTSYAQDFDDGFDDGFIDEGFDEFEIDWEYIDAIDRSV